MKANKLRIGNLLYQEQTIDDWEIKPVLAGTIIQCEINPDGFKPIPLTEEWLLRFGFKKNEPEISDGYFNWWNKEKSVSVDVEYVLTDNGVELLYYYVLQDINGCRPYKHIIYVHQLQNLYFALTGQELELRSES